MRLTALLPKSAPWLLIGLFSLGIAIISWLLWTGARRGDQIPRKELDAHRQNAYEFQIAANWCAAKKEWEQLKQETAGTEFADLRKEAEGNLALVTPLCKPVQPSVNELKVPAPPDNQRRAKLPEDKIVAFYPLGRTVRSLAYVDITGRGRNRQWAIQVDAHFAYRYKFAVVTKVIENRGTAVVFEQDFPEVVQLLATSSEEVQFDPPPWAQVVWTIAEKQVPVLIVVRKLAEEVNRLDPNAKRLLTAALRLTKRSGVPIEDDDPLGLAVQVEKLSGAKLQIEYVSGLGVTWVKVLKPIDLFNSDELTRLAHKLSPLIDFFIGEVAQMPAGETVEVPLADIAGLTDFGPGSEASGKLSLKNGGTTPKHPDWVELLLEGGEVKVQGIVDGVERTGSLRPIKGSFHYDPKDLLVRRADAQWQAEINWVGQGNLLFGTERITDLEIRTFYEADLDKLAAE